MVTAAQRLEQAGAEALVICTNTMHLMAPAVEAAVTIPLIHIADPTAAAIKAAGMRKVALLGTAFTMEQAFYKGRLHDHHGLTVITPDDADRADVHRIIYSELVAGVVREESRALYRAVITRLADQGAEAVILGCTEIMLLIGPDDSPIPIFDTTALHAQAAVDFALGS